TDDGGLFEKETPGRLDGGVGECPIPLIRHSAHLVQKTTVAADDCVEALPIERDQAAVGLRDNVALLPAVEHARRFTNEVARPKDSHRYRAGRALADHVHTAARDEEDGAARLALAHAASERGHRPPPQ